jgi:hypothetical protein
VDQDKPDEVRNRIADALADSGERDMAATMRCRIPPLHSQGRGTARSVVEGPFGIEEPPGFAWSPSPRNLGEE